MNVLKVKNVDQQEIHCNHIQLGDNFVQTLTTDYYGVCGVKS